MASKKPKTSSPQASASTPGPQASKSISVSQTNKSSSSPQRSAKSSSPGVVWPPTKCTPLCFEGGATGCSHAGKHHELIMALIKCSNGSEIDKTDLKKSLDKFAKTKWLRSGCVPDRNEKLRFPLVHWACMLGKFKPLEYLVSEKGFELTVKVGKNQRGPLHSLVQHLHSCLNPKSSQEYICNMFGNIVDVFLKYTVEAFCEKDPSTGDTILHYLAKRCGSDVFSRKYLKTLLVKIKESSKVSQEKLYEILSAVNRRGDTFLHVIVHDEESVETLNYFFGNFGLNSEKISKAKNNFGKTPRQIAVEKRSFRMLKALGAPDVVINSLQKAVTGGKPNTSTPKRVRFIDDKNAQKSSLTNSPAIKPSSEQNTKMKDKEASNHSSTSSNLTVQKTSTGDASSEKQQSGENVSSDQLEAEVLKLCSCDSPIDKKDQPSDSSLPTKRTVEPFPQRYPGNEENKTSPGTSVGAVDKAGEVAQIVDIPEDTPEATSDSQDRNVFLSLSNTISSLTKGDSLSNSRKRPALTTLKSKAPRRKRGRGSWSDSESDVEDDLDFNLDDDSDDDVESEEEDEEDLDEEEEEEEMEEDEEEIENEEAESVDNAGKKATEARNEDDIELETVFEVLPTALSEKRTDRMRRARKAKTTQTEPSPKHTPFCSQNCSSQHHKLLLSLLKCSNYNYGMAHIDTFMKQVNEYINQPGKVSDVRANADLLDPVPSFKYPLVHWVCVLGKFKVLERLAELKEFNLAVQSERTGETGLHRMLLSLDRAMVLRKSSVKTLLEVFSKTLRTLTENKPNVITVCNKEGDTPFHCLAKVILDCTGELERMNTYEGYFEHLMKELECLQTSGKLTSDTVKELLLKTNNSQETFLHILACRHGVGQRVIKSVLKNIEPEIMDVLKEIKDANGKTSSDLAEDLCSYEMAAILRPRDQEAGPLDGDDDVAEDLPQTPDSGAPQESPDVQSPPPNLFHPMDYPMSPFVPNADAARVHLFAVKKEPGVDDTVAETVFENPAEVNCVPSTLQTTEDVPLLAVKTSPTHANPSPTRPTEEDVNAMASASGTSESSIAAATVNHNMSSSMTAIAAIPGTSRESAGTPTTSASRNSAASSPPVSANHSKNSRSSVISQLSKLKNLPQTDKLLNTLHAKFKEQLAQSERGLGEKEEALVLVLQRLTEAQEQRQRLQQELDENLNEMLAIKQEEGVLRSEIAVQKRDCEKFKAELEKYAGIREQEK